MGRSMGLIDEHRWHRFCEKTSLLKERSVILESRWCQPGDINVETYLGQKLSREYNLAELLRRPKVQIEGLLKAIALDWPDTEVNEQLEIDLKYAGYIARQEDEIARIRTQHGVELPVDMDYALIKGLSNEVKQKLQEVQPQSIGQATRISGVTPAAISLLLIYLKKSKLLVKQHVINQ